MNDVILNKLQTELERAGKVQHQLYTAYLSFLNTVPDEPSWSDVLIIRQVNEDVEKVVNHIDLITRLREGGMS